MTVKMPGLISGAYGCYLVRQTGVYGCYLVCQTGAYRCYLVCQRSCGWDSVKECEMGRLGKLIILAYSSRP